MEHQPGMNATRAAMYQQQSMVLNWHLNPVRTTELEMDQAVTRTIDLLVALGLDCDSVDNYGERVENFVQTALQVVALRLPEQFERLIEAVKVEQQKDEVSNYEIIESPAPSEWMRHWAESHDVEILPVVNADAMVCHTCKLHLKES